MDCVYAPIKASYPASLINRKHALLLHDNAPTAHTAAPIEAEIKSCPRFKLVLIQHI